MARCASAQTGCAGHEPSLLQASPEVRQRFKRIGPSMASTTSRSVTSCRETGSSNPPVFPRWDTTRPARVRLCRTFDRNCSGHSAASAKSARLARKAAGLDKFGFHDCRHHFISYAVMSGIDFMTIARWVGHKDGGILIGKVYGHLSNEHAQAQAARMNFGPALVTLPQAAIA